jgi:xanthine dehydrogenase accessory factor
MQNLILVKGGGDIASGVAWRLHRSGFALTLLEISQPTVIRRTVAFASAQYEGEITVEGVTARKASLEQVEELLGRGVIPVLTDPEGQSLAQLRPAVLVDAILAKHNLGTKIEDAPLVIALGPGFRAGQDCHAVVETSRGHFLGRVYWQGEAQANTGIPGSVMGHTEDRVLRAPTAGRFSPLVRIGDLVQAGQAVASVGDQPVRAGIAGAVRGLLHEGLQVHSGMKIGDVDPRGKPAHCFSVSDKALAVGGGVLEAILTWRQEGAVPTGHS